MMGLWIVGGGALVALMMWFPARGRVLSLHEKRARCIHDFQQFDTAGYNTFYKCRRCGMMKKERIVS
jgi:hypothetical protein